MNFKSITSKLLVLLLVCGFLFLGAEVVKACTNGRWGAWVDTSSCVASDCGTSQGTKNQERLCVYSAGGNECNPGGTVCDKDCPSETFSASRQVVDVEGYYGSCPAGYTVDPKHENKCEKWIDPVYGWKYADTYNWFGSWYCPSKDKDYTSTDSSKPCSRWLKVFDGYTDYINRPWVEITYKTETFGPITFKYNKSSDPNKCHRPTGVSLGIPSWAMSDFNKLPEWKVAVDVNCRQIPADTQTQQVSCTDAPVVACPTDQPSPTPTPGGSEEPSPTPTATPVEEEPTPTPTPSSSTSIGGTSDGGGENPGAPSCNDAKPATPYLLSATSLGGDSIKTTWQKVVDPVTDYSIYYGPTSGNYLYSVVSTGNVDSYIVNGLSSGCFAIRAVNGCATSDLSNEVCTGAVVGTQVLGVSTMAGTGVSQENVFNFIFVLGSILSGLGVRKLAVSKTKLR